MQKEKFPIEPMFSNVVITLNKLDEGKIQLSASGLSDVQTIVATNERARVEVGDRVILDLNKLSDPQSNMIKIDPVEVDGVVYGFISENVIRAKDRR